MLVVAVLFMFACGWVAGTFSERCHWVSKANPVHRTATCVAGRFYYVIPEPELCSEWRHVGTGG